MVEEVAGKKEEIMDCRWQDGFGRNKVDGVSG